MLLLRPISSPWPSSFPHCLILLTAFGGLCRILKKRGGGIFIYLRIHPSAGAYLAHDCLLRGKVQVGGDPGGPFQLRLQSSTTVEDTLGGLRPTARLPARLPGRVACFQVVGTKQGGARADLWISSGHLLELAGLGWRPDLIS